MAAVRAADLPAGSIVASDTRVWIKHGDGPNDAPWLRTGSSDAVTNARIKEVLKSGRGHVLRYGYGEAAS